MSDLLSLESFFLIISFFTSVVNLSLLFYLIRSGKDNFVEKNLKLNTKEFDLIQRQFILLQARSDMNTKRVDTIEKVLSALIVSGSPSDDPGGFTH